VAAGDRSSFVLISNNPGETFRIGKILGRFLKGGDCVALTGELGAGKTSLTQGIARGLGVSDRYAVTSPTFTLINEYPGRDIPLFHLDVYRLTGPADLDETGYDEYLLGNGVLVIEWAEKILAAVPDDALFIVMSALDESVRKMEFSGCPDRIDFWKGAFRKGGSE